ncbi:hypothetical protein GCM10009639_32000 [Kitasatospora putterlickiae]|uniref:Uncharacterized protein n=1 Tax=Kitasatospora putterlickiae TaxID=221725 RepID=A0ABP4IQA2_9ACTN
MAPGSGLSAPPGLMHDGTTRNDQGPDLELRGGGGWRAALRGTGCAAGAASAECWTR